ncbi:hypothetical protein JST97_27250 [bacterium]|nr:hypothetical protein [bacterium]
MSETMIVCCPCPSCQEGSVGYRLCANRETVVLLCDNCALVWMHPNQVDADHARDPLNPEFARQHPQVGLRSSRWANQTEVNDWGWGVYLLKPGDLLKASDDSSTAPPS